MFFFFSTIAAPFYILANSQELCMRVLISPCPHRNTYLGFFGRGGGVWIVTILMGVRLNSLLLRS